MNRKETTEFLSNLLITDRFSGAGKYWAREVSLDYGTTNVRRVDFMQFCPDGVIGVSGIEKGTFTSYEVKSCKADFKSGFGQNFETEKNYFVMPVKVYQEIMNEIPFGVGAMIPVPEYRKAEDEFFDPTELTEETEWRLRIIKYPQPKIRSRSMIELLFCMLRSGQ